MGYMKDSRLTVLYSHIQKCIYSVRVLRRALIFLLHTMSESRSRKSCIKVTLVNATRWWYIFYIWNIVTLYSIFGSFQSMARWKCFLKCLMNPTLFYVAGPNSLCAICVLEVYYWLSSFTYDATYNITNGCQIKRIHGYFEICKKKNQSINNTNLTI